VDKQGVKCEQQAEGIMINILSTPCELDEGIDFNVVFIP